MHNYTTIETLSFVYLTISIILSMTISGEAKESDRTVITRIILIMIGLLGPIKIIGAAINAATPGTTINIYGYIVALALYEAPILAGITENASPRTYRTMKEVGKSTIIYSIILLISPRESVTMIILVIGAALTLGMITSSIVNKKASE